MTRALSQILGWILLAVGLAAVLSPLQHDVPYPFSGGNPLLGIIALGLGLWLSRPWLAYHRSATPLRWTALVASPFALYATLAELEEVLVVAAKGPSAEKAALRLWIVDRSDGAWVTMSRGKADAHGLDGSPVCGAAA